MKNSIAYVIVFSVFEIIPILIYNSTVSQYWSNFLKKRLPLDPLLVLHLNTITEMNLSVTLELFDTNFYNIPVSFFVLHVPLL